MTGGLPVSFAAPDPRSRLGGAGASGATKPSRLVVGRGC